MTISQNQLEVWSHQGSVTQSAATYATIKRAVENKLQARAVEVFLQGSYGNDTNIHGESDVDIVALYSGAFFKDLGALSSDQVASFNSHFSTGKYPYNSFKEDVEAALRDAFGSSVTPSEKAIKIAANGARRKADVIVAFEYRRYFKFNNSADQDFATGITFFTSNGTEIANYPKIHSKNLTAKHQATNMNFKPVVRIFKNIRSKLVEDGLIANGVAPSYFVEGLLYNVPNTAFVGNYQDMVLNVLNFLHKTTDRTEFLCANQQYYLLRDGSPVCWPTPNGTQFINSTIQYWNNA